MGRVDRAFIVYAQKSSDSGSHFEHAVVIALSHILFFSQQISLKQPCTKLLWIAPFICSCDFKACIETLLKKPEWFRDRFCCLLLFDCHSGPPLFLFTSILLLKVKI